MRLERILFPFDFSARCRQIVPFVRAFARQFGARVTVISVVPPAFESVPAEMLPHMRVGADVAEWKRNLQDQLEGALVEEFAGLDVERMADHGDAALRITHAAQIRNVDLIMMPTHGAGTFRGFLLGSVTSKVLHDAGCPVWTAAHTEVQTASAIPRTILCAVDGSSATPQLLQSASAFARSTGASLNIVHIVGPVSDWPALETERRLQEQVRESACARLQSMLTAAGIEAPYRVEVGDIIRATTEQARQQQADLVIIGRGSIAEPFGRLRTHAFGIIQHSPCPVVSV